MMTREELARSLGVAPLARVGKGVFKTLVATLPEECINPLDLLRAQPGRFDSPSPDCDGLDMVGFVCDANLWKSLDAAHGKCDAMVDGKYHRARVFAFETETRYIWCETETGDTGTSWFMARRDAKPGRRSSYSYARLGTDSETAAEVGKFFEDLMVGTAFAHEETLASLRKTVPAVKRLSDGLAAHAEADEIASVARTAAPSPVKRRKL